MKMVLAALSAASLLASAPAWAAGTATTAAGGGATAAAPQAGQAPAQGSAAQGNAAQGSATQGTTTQGATAGGTAQAGGTQAAAAPSANAQDRQFVRQAALGNELEAEMGNIAQKNAGTPAVREFGRWMATDHTLANTLLTPVAQQVGLQLPTSLDKSYQSLVDSMKKLTGTQFDQEYLSNQVQAHQQTIALFEQEAQSGEDPGLKALAQNLLPVLKQHLAQAQELQQGGGAQNNAGGGSGAVGSAAPGGGAAAK